RDHSEGGGAMTVTSSTGRAWRTDQQLECHNSTAPEAETKGLPSCSGTSDAQRGQTAAPTISMLVDHRCVQARCGDHLICNRRGGCGDVSYNVVEVAQLFLRMMTR